MSPKPRTLLALAAGLVVVGGASIRLWQREAKANRPVGPGAVQSTMTPAAMTLAAEQAVRSANLPIDGLQVAGAGEILVLRGTVDDPRTGTRAEEVARAAGAQRVANMIQVRKRRADDDIRREAERELALSPSLGDCRLAVSVERGVVKVSGKVRSEVQADLVRSTIRRVNGTERVETELTTF
jgi:osmotically-inducible protein OsmY